MTRATGFWANRFAIDQITTHQVQFPWSIITFQPARQTHKTDIHHFKLITYQGFVNCRERIFSNRGFLSSNQIRTWVSKNNFIPHPKKSPTEQSDRPCFLSLYAHNFFTRLIYLIPGTDPATEGRELHHENIRKKLQTTNTTIYLYKTITFIL